MSAYVHVCVVVVVVCMQMCVFMMEHTVFHYLVAEGFLLSRSLLTRLL